MTQTLKLFGAYLYDRRRTPIALGLCLGICGVIFALYQLPLAAVGYGGLLCAAMLALWGGVDFARYRSRHRQLEQLRREIGVTLEHLPDGRELLERDYCDLIRTLDEKSRAARAEDARRYRERVDYFTIWAHQIKTPIAAMRLLLQEEDSRESRALGEELQRIEQYVEMVLGYLRLDSDSSDYVLRSCDLDGVVRQAVRKFAGQFIRKKLKLVYEPLNRRVLTDEKWLLFAVEQILSNALKYTRSGQVTISLEEPCTLVIADTGIGIAPEDLPRVWEQGFTGYNGRADKRASGIGLYLCRRILTQLGHGISIVSVPGTGTQVRLDLEQHPLEVE